MCLLANVVAASVTEPPINDPSSAATSSVDDYHGVTVGDASGSIRIAPTMSGPVIGHCSRKRPSRAAGCAF